jgi:hypothetical protein
MKRIGSPLHPLVMPTGPLALAAVGLLGTVLAACPSSKEPAPGPPATQDPGGSSPTTPPGTAGGGPAVPPNPTPPAVTPPAPPAPPPVRGPGIIMRGNNLQRHGANLDETILAPPNVSGATFGKLYCRDVEGEVYGQMLYVPNLDFGAKGKRNALFVVTMKNRVYAFDADNKDEPALWEKSYIDEANNVTPVPTRDIGKMCGTYRDISSSVGILSTPAIDPATNTMYFVARTKEGAGAELKYLQRLHAVSMLDGNPRTGSPVVIDASMEGSGSGMVNGRVSFNPLTHNQRAALMLHDGLVYIAWASHCDEGPYHGWVLGYDAQTLTRVVTYNSTPNGENGGIWMSGAGPAVDDQGFIYFITGNGTADLGPEGGPNRGHSFVKLRRQGNTLDLVDWFTPFNYRILETEDRDLGSAGPVLIPGTNVVLGGGKEGKIYLVDRMNMGKHKPPPPTGLGDDNQIIQTVDLTGGYTAMGQRRAHNHGTPVYWKSQEGEFVYTMAESDYLKQFKVVDGKLQLYKMSALRAPIDGLARNTYTMPGGTLAISADGDKPGSAIVWVTINVSQDANNAVVPGMVRAFDASDVSTKELWNSQANPARDAVGLYAKFNPATVYNGKMYVPTFSDKYCVYGHLSQ